MDDTKFIQDVESLLTGKYKLPDGRVVKGQAASFALSEMNGRWGSLKSGRRWSGLGPLGHFEHECKRCGFQVTYHGHGLRIYKGGIHKFGAKAIVIHKGELAEAT